MTILKWFKPSLLALIVLACLTACSPPISDKRDFASAMLNSDSGRNVRGFQMGDTPEEVKLSEDFDVDFESDSLLVYEGVVPYDGRDVNVTVYYSFDDFGLFEIQFDIYPRSMDDASSVFLALKGKLTLIYGRPLSLKAGNGWRFNTFSPSNSIIDIVLTDESKESGTPFISLNFMEALEDEI